VSGGLRYFVGAVAFGFAAVWIMATLAGALVCLAAAVAGYGAIVVADRARAKRAASAAATGIATPTKVAQPSPFPDLEDFPLTPEALNSDLGYVYEPARPTAELSREYGWTHQQHNDETAWSEMPH
jgi:hypothetical protein